MVMNSIPPKPVMQDLKWNLIWEYMNERECKHETRGAHSAFTDRLPPEL
jgi:hypothetical protein